MEKKWRSNGEVKMTVLRKKPLQREPINHVSNETKSGYFQKHNGKVVRNTHCAFLYRLKKAHCRAFLICRFFRFCFCNHSLDYAI